MSKTIDGVVYYTVRFLNYAGTDLLGTCDVEAGGDATALAPAPEEIEGMEFSGWNVDITCVNEDMTVRPTYKSGAVYFTVNFLNYAGDDYLSSQKVKEGESASPPSPEKIRGLIFIGWNTSYSDIHEDKTIRPRYREIPPHPVMNFYRKNADNTPGSFVKSYSVVNGCRIVSKLDGECTMSFKMMTKKIEGFAGVDNIVELDGLVFNITSIKKNISSGVCYTEMECEHVSYMLNDDGYKVTAFDMEGTPRQILQYLLAGTPFYVGTVDMETTVTLRVNTETTRRACVMQLVALVKGEIEYYGYAIGIRRHRGNSETVDIMKTENVKDISCSYNATEQRYSYSLDLFRKENVDLGDELLIRFAPLSINTQKRVVGMEWNPFNYNEVSITVGAYIPTLNDTLYSLVSTVEDIRDTTAKYTVEFGEIIGNGSFYFTRAYNDRPYFQWQTDDGAKPVVTLNKKDGSAFSSYVGATISGVSSKTTTVIAFYCTVPDGTEEEEE